MPNEKRPWPEIGEIYDVAFAAVEPQLGGVLLLTVLIAAIACAIGWLRPRAPKLVALISLPVLVLGAAVYGLMQGWERLWLCDDAYISFRYSYNLAHGEGLVFNPGEWVEGYTNFLWTALLGVLGAIGFDIPLMGLYGNLLSYVLALGLVAAIVWRAAPEQPWVPWSTLALAASMPFATYASSGLETMPAIALVLAGMLATTWRKYSPLFAGLCFVGAGLMRPDHLLFWGCMGLAMASEDVIFGDGNWRDLKALWKRLDWRRYLWFTAPLVLIYLPYFLIRWSVYGDIFPNTYYAKSGYDTYYDQGMVYAAAYTASTGAWAWLSAFVITILGRPKDRHEFRLRLFTLLAVMIFGHYVVRVGGDFMLNRFLLVLMPITLVSMEVVIRWRLHQVTARKAWRLPLMLPVALGLAATTMVVTLIPEGQKKWFISDEWSYYRVISLDPLEIESDFPPIARNLHDFFVVQDITPPKVAFGSVGIIAYESKIPIFDTLGLTEREIAHKIIEERDRPGHEKIATTQEIIDLGVKVTLEYWRVHRLLMPWSRIRLPTGISLHMLCYDEELIERLRGIKGVKLPPTLKTFPQRHIFRERSRHLALFHTALFKDFIQCLPSEKQAALLAPIRARFNSIAEMEDPDELNTFTQEGDAFQIVLHHNKPMGAEGVGWAVSQGASTGRLIIPLPKDISELRLRIGGSAEGHRIDIVANGEVVRILKPQREHELSAQSVLLTAYQGQALEAHLIDTNEDEQSAFWVDSIRGPTPTNDIRQQVQRTLAQHSIRIRPTHVGLLRLAEQRLGSQDPDVQRFSDMVTSQRWTFDQQDFPDGFEVTGEAFGQGPVEGSLERQLPVLGTQGERIINSFHQGDGATGTLTTPTFLLPAQGVFVLVGGSRDCDNVFVGLKVNDQIIRRQCGQDDETLRAHVLQSRKHVNKPVQLVIVDRSKGGWGHILVDDIIIPKALSHPKRSQPPRNPWTQHPITPPNP